MAAQSSDRVNLRERPPSRGVRVTDIVTPMTTSLNDHPLKLEDRRAALCYVHEAFAEAIMAGIDTESFADAAIAAGLQELVACYGEEAVAHFAAELAERVRRGEFTIGAKH